MQRKLFLVICLLSTVFLSSARAEQIIITDSFMGAKITQVSTDYVAEFEFSCSQLTDGMIEDLFSLALSFEPSLFPEIERAEISRAHLKLFDGDKFLGISYGVPDLAFARRHNELIEYGGFNLKKNNFSLALKSSIKAELNYQVKGTDDFKSVTIALLDLSSLLKAYPRAQSRCVANYEEAVEIKNKNANERRLEIAKYFLTKIFPFILLVIFIYKVRGLLHEKTIKATKIIGLKLKNIKKKAKERKYKKMIEEEVIREEIRKKLKEDNDNK